MIVLQLLENLEDNDIYGRITLASVKRIIRNTGAARVSDDAGKKLAEVIEAYAEEVAIQATKLAEHAGSRTVTADDIKLAL